MGMFRIVENDYGVFKEYSVEKYHKKKMGNVLFFEILGWLFLIFAITTTLDSIKGSTAGSTVLSLFFFFMSWAFNHKTWSEEKKFESFEEAQKYIRKKRKPITKVVFQDG